MNYDRQKYHDAVKTQVEPNVYRHSLALEACMGGLYDYFQGVGQLDASEPAKEDWMLSGLIHDIDYSGEFKNFHPAKTKEALAKYNLDISDTVHEIVKAHDSRLKLKLPESKAQWALFCADSLTGLITAVALITQNKKLSEVKLSSVLKKFHKSPNFAAGTRRNEVAMCANPEGLNILLEKFVEICLISMQKVATSIDL